MSNLRPALILYTHLSLITAIAHLASPHQANGSILGYPHAPRGAAPRHAERAGTQPIDSALAK